MYDHKNSTVDPSDFFNQYAPRIDATAKALGNALFGPDIQLPGMLTAALLRSPFSHAIIKNIELSKARKLQGVRAVLIGKNCPVLYGRSIDDQPVLAIDKVRYYGEPVAAVAAIDADVAEEAIDLIKVDYEELEPVLDVEKAREQGGPLVHEQIESYRNTLLTYPIKGTNVCSFLKLRKGSIDEAFQNGDLIITDRYTSPMAHQCYLGPKMAIAQMDFSGNITVWSETGSPYRLTTILCRAFGLSHNQFRVVVPYIGGSFGGKSPVGVEPIAVALARKTNGQPVKIIQSRDDEFQNAMVKHAAIIDISSSVKKDGSILARQVEILLDTGAYACTGPTVLRNAAFTASGPYIIPNVKIDGLCVYSNKVPAGSLRGYGTPQMAWAYESHTDNIARALRIDPVEFRLKHLYRTGSETATGEILQSMALEECLKKAAEAINWNQKPVSHNNIKKGKGVACMQKASASPSASTAIVKLSEDGTIRVVTSAAELGQGVQTVLATIVANELRIPYDKIRVVLPDTDSTPYDESSTSSRATFHLGNAVMDAAIDVRNQLLQIAARTLGIKEDMLQINDGYISVKGAPKRDKYSYSHFISRGHYGKLSAIIGRGSFYSDYVKPFDQETGQSPRPTSFWMYAVQAAEVEVDTETGKIKILKLAAAHDVGKAISLVGCKQQIEGAVGMGIGQAIFEELILKDGRVLNTNFEDYKIPTIMDMPEVEAIVIEGAYSEHGPHGAKGLGEPALSATAAAIGNAVYDAIGLRIYDLPLSPEKVFMKLKQKEPASQK